MTTMSRAPTPLGLKRLVRFTESGNKDKPRVGPILPQGEPILPDSRTDRWETPLNRRWKRLVRFTQPGAGRILLGEPVLPDGETDIDKAVQARLLRKPDLMSHVSEDIRVIGRLEAPTFSSGVIRCLGLNYRCHAQEANLPIPKHPVVFYKPSTAANRVNGNIIVPRIGQDFPHIDYECELVVVIRRTCKDVSEDKALDCVAGYTVGNDISHRHWQLGLGGSQWNFGKSFDGWAPLGPGLVSPRMFGDKDPGNCTAPGSGLKIWTKVNGEMVQEGWTGDMIFGVARAISFLSQGTTLCPGDLIFMGTPKGVGMSRNPPQWLRHGDVVEVGLEGVGTLANTIVNRRQQREADAEKEVEAEKQEEEPK